MPKWDEMWTYDAQEPQAPAKAPAKKTYHSITGIFEYFADEELDPSQISVDANYASASV